MTMVRCDTFQESYFSYFISSKKARNLFEGKSYNFAIGQISELQIPEAAGQVESSQPLLCRGSVAL